MSGEITGKPGRRWAILSLLCAALALAVAPVVFGPLGVVAGCVAVTRGNVWWGAAGVSSAVAAVVGDLRAWGWLGKPLSSLLHKAI